LVDRNGHASSATATLHPQRPRRIRNGHAASAGGVCVDRSDVILADADPRRQLRVRLLCARGVRAFECACAWGPRCVCVATRCSPKATAG
jgi:hypothetical protein